MIICDRCGNEATYNVNAAGKKQNLCSPCLKKHYDLIKVINKLESDFMKNKFNYIKHIDFE